MAPLSQLTFAFIGLVATAAAFDRSSPPEGCITAGEGGEHGYGGFSFTTSPFSITPLTLYFREFLLTRGIVLSLTPLGRQSPSVVMSVSFSIREHTRDRLLSNMTTAEI